MIIEITNEERGLLLIGLSAAIIDDENFLRCRPSSCLEDYYKDELDKLNALHTKIFNAAF